MWKNKPWHRRWGGLTVHIQLFETQRTTAAMGQSFARGFSGTWWEGSRLNSPGLSNKNSKNQHRPWWSRTLVVFTVLHFGMERLKSVRIIQSLRWMGELWILVCDYLAHTTETFINYVYGNLYLGEALVMASCGNSKNHSTKFLVVFPAINHCGFTTEMLCSGITQPSIWVDTLDHPAIVLYLVEHT